MSIADEEMDFSVEDTCPDDMCPHGIGFDEECEYCDKFNDYDDE